MGLEGSIPREGNRTHSAGNEGSSMRATRRREGGCNPGGGEIRPLNTLKSFWSVSQVRSDWRLNFMATEPFDYAAVISDLEAKRAALDATIGSLRAAQALGALGQSGEGSSMGNTLVPSISGGEVPAGAFFSKSIPEAAKLYLAIVKRKQTSREIAEGLKKGGIESKSKSFNAQVHSILDRARKAGTGIFVKLDGHWGLAEWYPSALRAGAAPKPLPDGSSIHRAGRLFLRGFVGQYLFCGLPCL
jgi:hypothetical protein